MTDAPEIWKDVVGFEGRYQVSDLGRVRSSATLAVLQPFRSGGYLIATFSVRGVRAKKLVQDLVLNAFVGPRPPGHEALHRNGLRDDNALSNLRWGTKAENMADRDAHGTTPRGERVGNAKLTEKQVREILRDSRTLKAIAKDYGVHFSLISQIKRGKVWAHV